LIYPAKAGGFWDFVSLIAGGVLDFVLGLLPDVWI
jgi:hypothetical protein